MDLKKEASNTEQKYIIQLEGIDLSLAGKTVFKDMSLSIPKGAMVGLWGRSGSGKSTIIRLLVRFYDFDDSMIFLDGYDVNQIASADLRKRVGVVLQDFHHGCA